MNPLHNTPTDSGVAGLTTERLVALTLHDAWQFCGEDTSRFADMVDSVAVNCAKYHGLRLPDSKNRRQRMAAGIAALVQTAGERRFAFVVDCTLLATVNYAAWVDAGELRQTVNVGVDESPELGIADVSPAKAGALTVEDAWKLSGRDNATFTNMQLAVAHQSAKHRGLSLPDTDAVKRAIVSRVKPLIDAEPHVSFAAAVDEAVSSVVNYSPVPAATVAAYNQVRTCKDKSVVCHAPSTSMYFGRDGYVTACCYSRSNPLGQWPANSVAEIWSGEAITDMRGQMARNVLPIGCETCADQLRAGNFKGLLAGNFDSTVADTAPLAKLASWFHKPPSVVYPLRLEFELSNKCNLECEMCSGFFSSSIRSNRENLPALPQIYDSRFVEQLKPFIPHLKVAKFFGGEPFLVDIYYDIWELFIESNPGCEIIITTNGTVFTGKVQRLLEKLNFQVVVSLDSVNKPTYEMIRKNATLERTLENLESYRSILQRRGKKVVMAVCPMVHNWREIPDLVLFGNERGMPIFFNTVTYPESASLKYLPVAELNGVAEFLRQAIKTPKGRIEANNYRALTDLSHQVEMWTAEKRAAPSALLQVL